MVLRFATRTSVPVGLMPLVGETGVGAVALRPPGGVALVSACSAPLGETGLADFLPQATANAAARKTTDPKWNTRFIKPSPKLARRVDMAGVLGKYDTP